MQKKTILVFSASAGAGHRRAAEALVETSKVIAFPFDLRHHDILDFTFPLFRKVYSQMNAVISSKAPELWGVLYKKSDSVGIPKEKVQWMKLFDHFNYKHYLNFLEEQQPAAIICTHFLPYAAIAEELSKPSWNIPVFSIPTDYDVHSLWINPSVKHYYSASEEAAWTIQSHGIEKETISVTGIPVCPEFTAINDKSLVRNELGIEPNRFTIMILSGGYDTEVIEKLVQSLVEFLSSRIREKFQCIVVCGKNKKLLESISHITVADNINLKLHEFVTFVDRLMDASDVLITKSGGLTVTEALAKQLPMIIYDPMPGQECRNADYLTEHGTALRAVNFSNLHFKLKELIDQPSRLLTMKENASKIAKPNAAKDILNNIFNIIR